MSFACPSAIIYKAVGASRYPQTRLPSQPIGKRCHRTSHRLAQPSDDTVAQRMSYSGFRFEVFGKVQGVFFRACTAEEAQRLGIVGWVRNSPAGSVEGEAQGTQSQLDSFKDWLQHKGSPASRIDRCDISQEVYGLGDPSFSSFEVKR